MSQRSTRTASTYRTTTFVQGRGQAPVQQQQQQQMQQQRVQQPVQQQRPPQQQQQQRTPTMQQQQQRAPTVQQVRTGTTPSPMKPVPAAQVPLPEEDVVMSEANGEKKPNRAWLDKIKAGGVKKKPNKKAAHRRLKKYVMPKNATMALNELRPGVKYTDVPEGQAGPGFTVEVELPEGKKFRGFGMSKPMAKAAAAEAALQSFVNQVSKETNQEGNEVEVDDTPWGTLAAFAMHKLFADWQAGRIGSAPPMPMMPAAMQGFAGWYNNMSMNQKSDNLYSSFEAPQMRKKKAAAGGAAKTPAAPRPPKPKTELPADAASRHPVQLLNEMRPGLEYKVTAETGTPPNVTYQMAISTDNQTFSGEGTSKKLAKLAVAKGAVKALFGI